MTGTGDRTAGAPAARIALTAVVLGAMVLSACGDDGGSDPSGAPAPTTLLSTGYPQPTETLSVLLEMLATARWDEAARLTVEGQMALVALAEGADLETVSDYLRLGERGVGANFWAGFTQVAEEFLQGGIAGLLVVSQREYQAEQRPFIDFGLALPDAPEDRVFKLTVTRSDDRLWRVDVIATFVDVLAYRLSETAEIARATRTEDAALVSTELTNHIPSLQAALTDPALTDDARQGIRSALSAIQ